MAITIVIVPASFTPSEVYANFESALQDVGFKARTVSLPSVGLHSSGKKAKTMTDDAMEIARVVEQVYDSSDQGEVVLLAHSYGGIPASESMKFVSARNREAIGKPGVSRIIYVAAIALPVGVSNDEMRKRPPPDYARIEVSLQADSVKFPLTWVEDDWIITDHAQGAQYDFNDMSVEQGLAWAAKMQDQSAASFRERATYAGYDDVEVHYVRCTDDQCLPAEGTKRILGVLEGSSGKIPIVHEFASGHSPMISKPKELAEFIMKTLQ